MPGFDGFGRMLIVFGLMLAGIGLVISLLGHFNLGRLPGDVVWKRGNFTFFFPIATSLILSLVLTLILNLFLRR